MPTAATRKNPRTDKAKVEALQAEALLAEDIADGPTPVELVPGVTIRVLPARMWRMSSLTALRSGDFDTWAKKSLASVEDYEIFVEADPTLEQFEKFLKRMNEATEGN